MWGEEKLSFSRLIGRGKFRLANASVVAAKLGLQDVFNVFNRVRLRASPVGRSCIIPLDDTTLL